MELSVRNRIYLSIAALLLASGALGYFIIYPAVIQIIETAAKMEETRLTIEKKYLSGQYLRRATQDIEKVKKSAEILSNVFIFTGEEYMFLPEFEKQMLDLGYNVSSADLSETAAANKKTPSDTLNLAFSLQGDFPTLMNALALLRQTEHYINIDQVAFKTLSGNAIQLDVKARVYRINPDKIKNIIDGSEGNL